MDIDCSCNIHVTEAAVQVPFSLHVCGISIVPGEEVLKSVIRIIPGEEESVNEKEVPND